LERFQANLTQLLDEEDQQLTLKILEAEEKRKCILREKKKISAGLDEMKRLNERSRVSLRKEKEALEVEKVKRLQVERDVLPDRKQQFESLQRLLKDAESSDALFEKDLETGRKKMAVIRQRLEEQQQQLAQARGQLDQGHRQRDSNQAHKLLQVCYPVLTSLSLSSSNFSFTSVRSSRPVRCDVTTTETRDPKGQGRKKRIYS
jgi:hypothetical protein